ncbi:hypothetical protein BDP81DRAFT_492455, partial [Colletotrichum phormii]
DVLQNTILISGLHYAWNKGDLYPFEFTFVFQKIQSIRQVNSWLVATPHEQDAMRCAKYISTLCFIEVRRSYLFRSYTPNCNVVHCLKSRSDDTLATYTSPQGERPHSDHRESAHLINQWHVHEASDLDLRLRAPRMVPFFFGSVQQGRKPKIIDVYPTITALRNITKLTDLKHAKASADCTGMGLTVLTTPWQVWDSGGSSELLFAVISAHTSSFADKVQLPSRGKQAFISSWSGFCVGVGMYLIAVLGI